MEFSELSKSITKDLSAKEKKNDGIFFTPPSIIKKTIEKCKTVESLNNLSNLNILEPSCGSCEFINYLNKNFNNQNKITGIEYNKKIYDKIKNIFENNNTSNTSNTSNTINLLNENFITYATTNKYNLIVGNPPYYVMKKADVDSKYYNYIEGRPNIYTLFIIKCMFMLDRDGVLAFVIPKNFLNCIYYNKLRKYIYSQYEIIDIQDCSDDKYLETAQDTIVLILQNRFYNTKQMNEHVNSKYFYINNDNYVMNTINNIKKINELYRNSNTLDKLGFKVSVGNVVWNQVKSELTDDKNKTMLIYNSNFKNNKLETVKFKDDKKKQYINKEGIKECMLVINRGYGVGEFKLNYCLINDDKPYLFENHVLCIRYIGISTNTTTTLTKQQLIDKYNIIINSLKNKKTNEFIKIYCGNNAINTYELNNVLPIFN